MTCSNCGKESSSPRCAECMARDIETSKTRTQAIWATVGASIIAFMVSLEPSLFGGIRWKITLPLWAVTALLPALAGYLIKGRKGDWKGYMQIVIIAILSVSASTTFTKPKREPIDQRMGRIMQEALGVKPVSNADTEEAALRDLFKDFYTQAKDVGTEYTLADATHVYDADSFQNADTMRAQLAQIEQLLAANSKAQKLITGLPELAKTDLGRGGLSAARAEEFGKLVLGKLASGAAPPYEYLKEEARWAADTKKLYEFALQHADAISARNGQIMVSGDDLLNDFNAAWDKSMASQQSMESARAASGSFVKANLSRFGIKPEDVTKK